MKTFLYGMGIAAETGMFAIMFLILWSLTEWDVLEIFSVDILITSCVSLLMFLKIEEIAKGEK